MLLPGRSFAFNPARKYARITLTAGVSFSLKGLAASDAYHFPGDIAGLL